MIGLVEITLVKNRSTVVEESTAGEAMNSIMFNLPFFNLSSVNLQKPIWTSAKTCFRCHIVYLILSFLTQFC